MADRVDLWVAINRYVQTCGGDPSANFYGNTRRQEAVADIERLIDSAPPPTGEDVVEFLREHGRPLLLDVDTAGQRDAAPTINARLRLRALLERFAKP